MGSGATSRYALEYPIGTDPVNIPSDIETLANDLDALLFSLSIVGKSANYQATIGQLVQMSGAHIVSSPTARANVMWGAQNVSSGTAVVVAPTTGLLNLPGNYGAASVSLQNQGDWAIFVCDGTNHNLITGSPSILPASSVCATASEVELTTTSATGVLAWTPPFAGNFHIGIYFRVVTATTTVTARVAWQDVSGPQTYFWANAVSEPVNSYPFPDITINSRSGYTISVIAQAGTANQVYISASILPG